jgi:acetylornithine deacetylase
VVPFVAAEQVWNRMTDMGMLLGIMSLDPGIRKRIDQHVTRTAEQNRMFLRELLMIPKPRMQEQDAIHFAADALTAAGCEVDVFEGEGIGEPTPAGPPLNCLAHRKGSDGGPSLLLEAHMDAVPVGMRERWTRDPWGAEEIDGRIYARGAHDDVAGAALVCVVARAIDALRLTPAGDVYFLLTTEEEYSDGGMRALIKRRPDLRPDAHLLVDGNGGPEECIVGHPGSVSFAVRIPGPFGSAQSPVLVHDGNPIEFASRVIEALRRLEEQIAQAPSTPVGALAWPKPTLVVVDVRSSGWISNVPEWCEVRFWGNVIPPMTIEQYRKAVESAVAESTRGAAGEWFAAHPPEVRWGPIEVPALVSSTDSPFYRALGEAHAASFGTTLVPRLIGGWGDMRLLNSGQSLFYGPGRGGGDHSYDEFYVLEDFNPMLRSLLYLIADWCGLREVGGEPA